MSLILSSLLTISSLFALEGNFEVTGDYEVLQEKRVEVVFYSKTDEVQKLKADKYQCGLRGRFYKCVKFIKKPSLKEGMVVSPNRRTFEFGPIKGKEIIAEGEDLLQYDTEQVVYVDGKKYVGTRYTETSRIEKIQIGLENKKESVYVIVNEDGISELQFYNKSSSRFSWVEYMTSFFYECKFSGRLTY